MFGFRFIKVPPTTYLLRYADGKVRQEGAGLSFFYYAPTTTLVSVPLASKDVPFIFADVTADFQEVSVQGQVTYRIARPHETAGLLNFTLDAGGRYVSDDPEKLGERVINQVHVLVRGEVERLTLRDAVRGAEALAGRVLAKLVDAPAIASLGLEVLGLSIVAVRPTPDTARALEAEQREALLREADQATYTRRNAAIEQERAIQENQLNTEIAVENKRRQIEEAKREAMRSVREKERQIQREDMEGSVALEEQRRQLVATAAENARAEADARAYAASALAGALGGLSPEALEVLASTGMDSGRLVALAFRRLAQNAEKIGHLNVSPDLLRELIDRDGAAPSA
ncbi:MAG TPA: SPFH domain-containing protein [Rhodothermales bacterium]|nr:SPFH domain-containing protein [Rhodothermales bacterium]